MPAAGRRFLEEIESADAERLRALGADHRDVASIVEDRLSSLAAIWPHLASRWRAAGRGEPERLVPALWFYELPLALQIAAEHRATDGALIQGIVGPPGAGKSTFAGTLAAVLRALGVRVLVLSLDDLYLPFEPLQAALLEDPRLRWRGPPGTHDLELARRLLPRLAAGEPVSVPRFDKAARDGAGDRVGFEECSGAEVVLLEGWLVGLRPRPEAAVYEAMPSAGQWALDCALEANRRLAGYEPLWDPLRRLMLLHPGSWSWVRRWRIEAEGERRRAGRGAMTEAGVAEYVDHLLQAVPPAVHYDPLLSRPDRVSSILDLGPRRQIRRLRRPGLAGEDPSFHRTPTPAEDP